MTTPSRQRPNASQTLERRADPELFRALSDPTRLEVLGRLASSREPLTVTDIAGCCGVHLSGVSRHLTLLKAAGVVQATRRGREVFYSLRADALIGSLRRLADALEACPACACQP